jgi:hypothetical protein
MLKFIFAFTTIILSYNFVMSEILKELKPIEEIEELKPIVAAITPEVVSDFVALASNSKDKEVIGNRRESIESLSKLFVKFLERFTKDEEANQKKLELLPKDEKKLMENVS